MDFAQHRGSGEQIAPRNAPDDVHADSASPGFTLIELLIVIVILGILATVVVFSVRGIKDDGQETACSQHKRAVATAVESYFADHLTSALPTSGPPDAEQYERGLVAAQFIRGVSVYYDIAVDGSLTPETGSPCP